MSDLRRKESDEQHFFHQQYKRMQEFLLEEIRHVDDGPRTIGRYAFFRRPPSRVEIYVLLFGMFLLTWLLMGRRDNGAPPNPTNTAVGNLEGVPALQPWDSFITEHNATVVGWVRRIQQVAGIRGVEPQAAISELQAAAFANLGDRIETGSELGTEDLERLQKGVVEYRYALWAQERGYRLPETFALDLLNSEMHDEILAELTVELELREITTVVDAWTPPGLPLLAQRILGSSPPTLGVQ